MGLFGFGRKKTEAAPASSGEVTLGDGSVHTLSQVVDCIGDSCPRPQIMTKKALGEVSSGQVIEVMVDNPSSVEAIPPMLDGLNATHLETIKGDHCWEIYVRKD